MNDEFKRKLTAVLSADVLGYSWLMSKDEVAIVQRIKLAELSNTLDATRCAIEVQRELNRF